MRVTKYYTYSKLNCYTLNYSKKVLKMYGLSKKVKHFNDKNCKKYNLFSEILFLNGIELYIYIYKKNVIIFRNIEFMGHKNIHLLYQNLL